MGFNLFHAVIFFLSIVPLTAQDTRNNTTDVVKTEASRAYHDPTSYYPKCDNFSVTGMTCSSCFDGILVWPETIAGTTAYMTCPTLQNNEEEIGYATRQCLTNGYWNTKANYSVCISAIKTVIEGFEKTQAMHKDEHHMVVITVYIFLAGFVLSNVAMMLAIFIFAKFKHLRCLRNLIHSQLLTAITIKNFIWMVLKTRALYFQIFEKPLECKIVLSLMKFFQISQYSWMFVEGLYLYLAVVHAFMVHHVQFRHCLAIGWGIPALVGISWILINFFLTTDSPGNLCWLENNVLSPGNALEVFSVSVLLVVNVVFMMAVVYTLFRKLRNSVLNESRQYRKAVKAALILFPLLGGLYILLFINPTPKNNVLAEVWHYTSAALQSLQGLIAALIYCFLNGEVKASIIKSHRRWKDEKTLPSTSLSTISWWNRRRRSSSAVARKDDTDTDTYNSSSRRGSRRVSDEICSRRSSHTTDTVSISLSKIKKPKDLMYLSPVSAFRSRLTEERI